MIKQHKETALQGTGVTSKEPLSLQDAPKGIDRAGLPMGAATAPAWPHTAGLRSSSGSVTSPLSRRGHSCRLSLGTGRDCFMGLRFLIRVMKMLSNQIVVMLFYSINRLQFIDLNA